MKTQIKLFRISRINWIKKYIKSTTITGDELKIVLQIRKKIIFLEKLKNDRANKSRLIVLIPK